MFVLSHCENANTGKEFQVQMLWNEEVLPLAHSHGTGALDEDVRNHCKIGLQSWHTRQECGLPKLTLVSRGSELLRTFLVQSCFSVKDDSVCNGKFRKLKARSGGAHPYGDRGR